MTTIGVTMGPFRRGPALAVGGIGTVALLLGAIIAPHAFYPAYLVAFLFWLGLSLGGLALLMLHHLVGGRWGFAIQRLLEAAAATLPLMAVAFLPILLGMHDLFHWADAEAVSNDAVLQHKAPYLNVGFWVARAVFYFAVWIGLSWLLRRFSSRQDNAPEEPRVDAMKSISAPGLVAYVLTMSFAAIDWGMALDPHWFSTIYGLIFVVSQGLSLLAFVLVLVPRWRRNTAIEPLLGPDRVQDLGKLLFAFVMLWGYVNVSQFLIIWMGNLPEETGWYMRRTSGAWAFLALALVLLQFAVPFFLLLSRRIKRSASLLAAVAGLVLMTRLIDLFWLVKPSEHHPHLSLHWLDVVAPLALGGLWIAMFLWSLAGRAPLPHGDPRLRQVMEETQAHEA